jgi:histidine ammonia-lyase
LPRGRHIARPRRATAAVYGVNTGFGKLASIKIAPGRHRKAAGKPDPVALLRRGAPMPGHRPRLMMVLKLLSLGRGASGVRWVVVELIEDMLAKASPR